MVERGFGDRLLNLIGVDLWDIKKSRRGALPAPKTYAIADQPPIGQQGD
ncbi:MAG: hypothetical protein HC860_10095 [Alkalinema sp. RU_4_3]|nr:hypothetical protein [Alkalinema sp. RU_4_3]